MSDFNRLLLGLLASARRIDRDHALLGALGVGAMSYAHQVDSVQRMITGVNCRWLLADEVGLGKTIQAIMVMRALAAQSPRPINVALVVPDDLASQWAEELLCRGHILPIEVGQDGNAVGNIVLRLARPSLLLSDKRLNAEKLDLLIIDEFTKLQAQVRRDLISASNIVPNIIVLTATPALHLAATQRELMAILEPEASVVARAENRDILAVLADREAVAIERYGKQTQDAGMRRAVEEAYGLYRHVIRTARTDYPNALPRRNYQPIRLTPTDGDVERAKTTRSYLEAAQASNLDVRRDLLLQVAGRSPLSLRDRLSTLRRTTPSLQFAWQNIDACLRDELGDAKLDALIDHLSILFSRDRSARVVVVGEDNPTTDYLRDAIEKLVDVRVAKKRRTVGASDNLEVHVATLKEALDDFINGEANVLVASDAAREGHNLQFADEIIFFALPWSPPDIQQWIGRIDRLGTKGQPANRRITITPIVIDGSIEEKILDVLEATGVFLKSEVFDESDWEAISNAISAAAYGSGSGNWTDAVREAKALGNEYDAWLQATRLPPSSRTSIATRRDAGFANRSYALPMAPINGQPWNWYVMREIAAETMLKLAHEEYLEIRSARAGDQRFRTMWYKSRTDAENGFTLPDLDTRSSWYRQAFIFRRDTIECPPRTHVVHNDAERRRLHFFDHGCMLHDGAIESFEKQTPKVDVQTEFVVEFPIGHPALEWKNRRCLVATAEFDLRQAIIFDFDDTLSVVNQRNSKPEQDARTSAARRAFSQFQADRRWMIDLAPPELLITVLVEDGDNLVEVDAAASALLTPFHGRQNARQLSRRRLPPSEGQLQVARSLASERLNQLGLDCLRRETGALRAAVKARLFAAQADADNIIVAAQADLAAANTLDVKHEFNKAAQRGAALSVHLAERMRDSRLARLNNLEGKMREVAKLANKRMFWITPRAPTTP